MQLALHQVSFGVDMFTVFHLLLLYVILSFESLVMFYVLFGM